MWIFLPVLKVFLNLAHFIRAELTDAGKLVLYRPDQVRGLEVTDPQDIGVLRTLFEAHGLTQLVVGTTDETSDAPPPAEAATDVEVKTPQSVDPPAKSDTPPTAVDQTATPPVNPQTSADAEVTQDELAPPTAETAKDDSPADAPATKAEEPASDKPVDAPAKEEPAPSSPFLRR